MDQNAAVTDRRRGPLSVLVGVLLRPRDTMTYLGGARRRWWWVAAILMVVALTLNGYAYGAANAEYNQKLQAAFLEDLPSEQRGARPDEYVMVSAPQFGTVVRVGGQVVGTLVSWLVWAGLLYLASTFLGQNGSNFGGFFAMVAWAWMPYVIRNVVQAIYTQITRRPIYNQGLSGFVIDKTPVGPTVGFRSFVPPARGDQVLAALLTRLDIYMIWNLVLLVLGVAALAHLSRRKAIAGTLAIWAVFTLLSLLPALIGLNQGMGIF
jgi:hypothetical protein